MASTPRSTVPGSGSTTRSRMLVALALTGSAALLVGCGASDPSAPSSPPVAVTGADPVPIAGDVLQASGLFEDLGGAAVAVRWVQPGESIAVVVGGSGSGGECIPQPHAAGLEQDGGSIVVRFDPPNPEVVCTMDFTLHGWQLGLAEPIDASGTVPVRLVNTSGAEEVIEVELGPDDLLVSETADPQPTEVEGDAGQAPAPSRLPDALLPDLTETVDPAQEPPAAVRWIEPGTVLAVLLGGSGSEQCVPVPSGATVTGPGAIEVALDHPTGDMDCSADLRLYGWRVELAEPVSATLPVEVTVAGAEAGAATVITLQPDDVLAMP